MRLHGHKKPNSIRKWLKRLPIPLIVAASLLFSVWLSNRPAPIAPVNPALVPVVRPNGNDYPAYLADAPTDSFADPWGAGNRECTSYVSWKVYETYHDMPHWTGTQSDALNWAKLASAAGFKVSTTPAVGTVAVFQPGWTATLVSAATTFTENEATGHVAWVEAVNSDGSILVSEYSGATGDFARTTYPSTGLQFIYFGQRV